jgi:hypothetical protein
MDEIDNVVDNLFSQYIPKKKDVVPMPSEPPPSTGPEPEPDLDPPASIPAASHTDIVQKSPEPHQDIIKRPGTPQPKLNAAAKAAVKAQKVAAPVKPAKKKAAAKVSVPVDIAKIKVQTGKMLRHLHKAIRSENWWHKLYYANKFLLLAVTISKTITKRERKT